MQAERRAWPMTSGQSPGGGNLRRLLDEFNSQLNIFLSAFCVCGCFVSVLCRYAILAGAACPMMTGGLRPGCAAAAPGPGAAGRREGTMGVVAEKGPALPRTGVEYCDTSSPTLPGPGVSENCRGGSPESWLEIIWEQFLTSERRRFFPVLLFDLYRVTVTMGRLYADAEMTG